MGLDDGELSSDAGAVACPVSCNGVNSRPLKVARRGLGSGESTETERACCCLTRKDLPFAMTPLVPLVVVLPLVLPPAKLSLLGDDDDAGVEDRESRCCCCRADHWLINERTFMNSLWSADRRED